MTPRRSAAPRALLAVFATALLTACALRQRQDPLTQRPPDAPDLVAAQALPTWLADAGPDETAFTAQLGRDKGKQWRVTPSDIEKNDAGRVTAFTLNWTFDSEPAPRSERRMLVTDAGDLVMARVLQRDRSVITAFDPPILVVPARINAGATIRQDSSVTVYDLAKPTRVKDKGTATLEARHLGIAAPEQSPASAPAQSGRTPAWGAPPRGAIIYTTNLTIELGAATSQRFTERWFLPTALLREAYEERIRVLGVTIDSTTQALDPVQAEPVPADPALADPAPADPTP